MNPWSFILFVVLRGRCSVRGVTIIRSGRRDRSGMPM